MQKLKSFLYHLFIPNEKNDYKAKSIHLDFLLIYLIIALFLNFYFKKINFTNVLGFATDISVQKLYELTNKERKKNNLPNLNYNEKLSKAAYEKAKDMFSKNYWSHFSPDGKKPWDFILESGYQYEYAGENLAKNFLFSNGVIDAWMNSPSHRENILKKEYTDVGFAVVNGVLNNEETTLVVQILASPLSSQQTKNINSINDNIKSKIDNSSSEIVENKNSLVLSNNSKNNLNIGSLIFKGEILFFSFLLIVLIFDIYFAKKLKIIRFDSKNVAHFIFVLFILLGIIIISKGKII